MSSLTQHHAFNPMRDHCYIAIEWGTSRLKAFLCRIHSSGNAEILDEADAAVVQNSHEAFVNTILEITRSWRASHGLLPIFMGGHIGASNGPTQSTNVACPVAPADIVNAQTDFDCEGQVINIIPGISCQHANGNVDLMFSEQIQVLGWLQASAAHRNGTYLICLPSSHTKWVWVKDGIIQIFKTAITGELNVDDASSSMSALLVDTDVRAAMQSKEWRIQNLDEIIIISESHISDLFERVIRNYTSAVRCFHGKQAMILGYAAIRQRYLALHN